MQVTIQPYPTTSEQQLSFSEPGPEGPVVMVNLLKFRDQATCPDGTDSELSGREAFARYQQEAERLIEDHGGRDLFTGAVSILRRDVREGRRALVIPLPGDRPRWLARRLDAL